MEKYQIQPPGRTVDLAFQGNRRLCSKRIEERQVVSSSDYLV